MTTGGPEVILYSLCCFSIFVDGYVIYLFTYLFVYVFLFSYSLLFSLRTSEANYLHESFGFYSAIRSRAYYSQASKEEK